MVDGKLKNINQANFFLLNNLKILFDRFNKKLKIIEYGGGVGQRYYEFSKLIGKNKKIDWTIIEQNKYCKYSAKKNNKIKFIKSFKELSKHNNHNNILIYSTSLQYLENPYEEIKKILKDESIKYLFIENLPISNDNDKSLLQRHYSDKKNYYSFQMFNNKKIMDLLNKKFELKKKFFKQNVKRKNLNINFNFYDLFFLKKLN